jgi:hypothetical protein
VDDASELLKAIAGRIVTRLVEITGYPADYFFPDTITTQSLEDYPTSSQPASDWDVNFQAFLDRLNNSMDVADE